MRIVDGDPVPVTSACATNTSRSTVVYTAYAFFAPIDARRITSERAKGPYQGPMPPTFNHITQIRIESG